MDAQIYRMDDMRSARNTALLTSKNCLMPLELAGLVQQQAMMCLNVTSFLVQSARISLSFHAQVMSSGYWQFLRL